MNTVLPMKSKITSEKVARYVVEKIIKEPEVDRKLRLQTSGLAQANMISGSDVGSLLGMLVQSVNAEKAIEVGTFTGYTALKVAQALPASGQLVCCDISDEWTSIGKLYWQEAGVDHKIDLRLAPAEQTLKELLKEGAGTYDFAFIDADKTGYDNYYELCLQLLRPGGLIVLDNMLWDGKVADENVQDESTRALRNLNAKISQDARVTFSLLTVGDGLMLARKK